MKRLGLLPLLLLATPAYALDAKKDIQHIIVISLENHSFDNLFGTFPGADGLDDAKRADMQTDHSGSVYKALPPVRDTRQYPPVADTRFPARLRNQPFAIDDYIKPGDKTGDLTHRFYQEQDQINGGRMDRFAAISDAGGLAMGYYKNAAPNLWKYASDYTLADHFFHGAFGGSFVNHMWMICACVPKYEDAPEDMHAKLDGSGELTRDGSLTPDGYAVNTIFSRQKPHPWQIAHEEKLLPALALPTIGDALSEQHISWAWYSGGWNDAEDGKPAKEFQFHHQPFAYFKNYAEGTDARREHLKDEAEFLADLKNGTLPAVVFYKPIGELNLHPGYADVASGDRHIADIIEAIMQSSAWKSSVIIITFDENGGYWDHVAPPKKDRWGPGVRVPTIIISPLAKKHYIDHSVYDTTSILNLIEWRFGVKPFGLRDKATPELLGALE